MKTYWGNFLETIARFILAISGALLLAVSFINYQFNAGIIITGLVLVSSIAIPKKFLLDASMYWSEKKDKLIKYLFEAKEMKGNKDAFFNDNDDQPIYDESKDFFGYKGEASILSDYVSDFSENASRVIAIESPWGNGKTSLINLMIKELNRRFIKKDDKIEIIHFDPWFYSKSSSLTEQIIEQLLKTKNLSSKTEFKRLLTLLKLANSVNPENNLQAFLNTLMDLFESNETIHKQRKDIRDRFKKNKHRMLVVIDDIDRLQPDQILEVFKMVKSVVDLPYVNYCISFDPDSIYDSIKHIGLEPRRYLEKIIQDSIHLLVPNRSLLMRFFDSRISPALADKISLDQNFKSEWAYVVSDFQELIDTARKAKKLAFNINHGYARVGDEVNLVEFLCIQAIKLHDEKVFRLVHQYKYTLTSNDLHQTENLADLKQKISMLELKNKAVMNLLKRMFPVLSKGEK